MLDTTWRTRLDRSPTIPSDLAELRAAVCRPQDNRGSARNAMIVKIPEASNVQIAHALKMADKLRCGLLFFCGSRGQANAIAERMARQRPEHRSVPLERAGGGLWGPAT